MEVIEMSATAVPEKVCDALVENGFMSIREASDHLAMSVSAIYGLMAKGELRWAKFGKARRISKRSLLEYASRALVPA
jgi:excisionase family DNA binding protein